MKGQIILYLIFVFSSVLMGQEDKQKVDMLNDRVEKLAALTSELLGEVDSLKSIVKDLKEDIERSKWNSLEKGFSEEKVMRIFGNPTKVEEASFGYKKLIFGEGYSGYVLFDKEMKTVDWTPPLYLRIKMNN